MHSPGVENRPPTKHHTHGSRTGSKGVLFSYDVEYRRKMEAKRRKTSSKSVSPMRGRSTLSIDKQTTLTPSRSTVFPSFSDEVVVQKTRAWYRLKLSEVSPNRTLMDMEEGGIASSSYDEKEAARLARYKQRRVIEEQFRNESQRLLCHANSTLVGRNSLEGKSKNFQNHSNKWGMENHYESENKIQEVQKDVAGYAIPSSNGNTNQHEPVHEIFSPLREIDLRTPPNVDSPSEFFTPLTHFKQRDNRGKSSMDDLNNSSMVFDSSPTIVNQQNHHTTFDSDANVSRTSLVGTNLEKSLLEMGERLDKNMEELERSLQEWKSPQKRPYGVGVDVPAFSEQRQSVPGQMNNIVNNGDSNFRYSLPCEPIVHDKTAMDVPETVEEDEDFCNDLDHDNSHIDARGISIDAEENERSVEKDLSLENCQSYNSDRLSKGASLGAQMNAHLNYLEREQRMREHLDKVEVVVDAVVDAVKTTSEAVQKKEAKIGAENDRNSITRTNANDTLDSLLGKIVLADVSLPTVSQFSQHESSNNVLNSSNQSVCGFQHMQPSGSPKGAADVSHTRSDTSTMDRMVAGHSRDGTSNIEPQASYIETASIRYSHATNIPDEAAVTGDTCIVETGSSHNAVVREFPTPAPRHAVNLIKGSAAMTEQLAGRTTPDITGRSAVNNGQSARKLDQHAQTENIQMLTARTRQELREWRILVDKYFGQLDLHLKYQTLKLTSLKLLKGADRDILYRVSKQRRHAVEMEKQRVKKILENPGTMLLVSFRSDIEKLVRQTCDEMQVTCFELDALRPLLENHPGSSGRNLGSSNSSRRSQPLSSIGNANTSGRMAAGHTVEAPRSPRAPMVVVTSQLNTSVGEHDTLERSARSLRREVEEKRTLDQNQSQKIQQTIDSLEKASVEKQLVVVEKVLRERNQLMDDVQKMKIEEDPDKCENTKNESDVDEKKTEDKENSFEGSLTTPRKMGVDPMDFSSLHEQAADEPESQLIENIPSVTSSESHNSSATEVGDVSLSTAESFSLNETYDIPKKNCEGVATYEKDDSLTKPDDLYAEQEVMSSVTSTEDYQSAMEESFVGRDVDGDETLDLLSPRRQTEKSQGDESDEVTVTEGNIDSRRSMTSESVSNSNNRSITPTPEDPIALDDAKEIDNTTERLEISADKRLDSPGKVDEICDVINTTNDVIETTGDVIETTGHVIELTNDVIESTNGTIETATDVSYSANNEQEKDANVSERFESSNFDSALLETVDESAMNNSVTVDKANEEDASNSALAATNVTSADESDGWNGSYIPGALARPTLDLSRSREETPSPRSSLTRKSPELRFRTSWPNSPRSSPRSSPRTSIDSITPLTPGDAAVSEGRISLNDSTSFYEDLRSIQPPPSLLSRLNKLAGDTPQFQEEEKDEVKNFNVSPRRPSSPSLQNSSAAGGTQQLAEMDTSIEEDLFQVTRPVSMFQGVREQVTKEDDEMMKLSTFISTVFNKEKDTRLRALASQLFELRRELGYVPAADYDERSMRRARDAVKSVRQFGCELPSEISHHSGIIDGIVETEYLAVQEIGAEIWPEPCSSTTLSNSRLLPRVSRYCRHETPEQLSSEKFGEVVASHLNSDPTNGAAVQRVLKICGDETWFGDILLSDSFEVAQAHKGMVRAECLARAEYYEQAKHFLEKDWVTFEAEIMASLPQEILDRVIENEIEDSLRSLTNDGTLSVNVTQFSEHSVDMDNKSRSDMNTSGRISQFGRDSIEPRDLLGRPSLASRRDSVDSRYSLTRLTPSPVIVKHEGTDNSTIV